MLRGASGVSAAAGVLLRNVKLQHIIDQSNFKSSVTVQKECTVHTAIPIVRKSREGAVVVMEGQKAVGIFTEGDVVDLLLCGANLHVSVGREMSGNVVTATPDMTLGEALALMRGNKVRHLPIASFLGPAIDDDTRVTHIVSQNDLLCFLADVAAETKQ